MSTSSVRFVLKYLATWVAIWTVSLGAAEGVFRLGGELPSEDMGGLYEPFGDGNYKLRAFADTGARWSTGAFTVHTDSLGLRCDAARQMGTKSNDQIDWLFGGDSQGFGNGVNFEDTIVGTVASRAAALGQVVRNASVGGQMPLNQLELAMLLRERDGLRVANYVYLFTPVALASCAAFNSVTVGSDGRLYGEATTPMTTVRAWIKTHSVAYNRVRDAVRAAGIGVQPDQETPFVFALYQTAEAEERNMQQCVDVLQRMKRFAKDGGASLQVVYLPLTLEMNFGAIQSGAQERGLAVDINAPFRVLSAAAKAADVRVHDLRPILRDLHSTGQPLSLFPDFHYTPAVSKAVGAAIWQRVIAPQQSALVEQ